MPQKLATSLVFIKQPRNAQMKRLANRKIMIFKLVVATYITYKVAFFLQSSITHPYHICYNKWYSFLGLFYNISFPIYIYYNKEDHMLSRTILRCLEVTRLPIEEALPEEESSD